MKQLYLASTLLSCFCVATISSKQQLPRFKQTQQAQHTQQNSQGTRRLTNNEFPNIYAMADNLQHSVLQARPGQTPITFYITPQKHTSGHNHKVYISEQQAQAIETLFQSKAEESSIQKAQQTLLQFETELFYALGKSQKHIPTKSFLTSILLHAAGIGFGIYWAKENSNDFWQALPGMQLIALGCVSIANTIQKHFSTKNQAELQGDALVLQLGEIPHISEHIHNLSAQFEKAEHDQSNYEEANFFTKPWYALRKQLQKTNDTLQRANHLANSAKISLLKEDQINQAVESLLQEQAETLKAEYTQLLQEPKESQNAPEQSNITTDKSDADKE